MQEKFIKIISNGIKNGSSDIHITGGHRVVFRKNGEIYFTDEQGFTSEELDILVKQILSPSELKILKRRYSVDLAKSFFHIRVRINIFVTTRGLSIAMRLLPGAIPDFEALNLHPCFKEICLETSGLILICGATGSGKTTTMAAMLNHINQNRRAHVITLEDPVEYRFSSKNSFFEQRELGAHLTSFDQGLLDVLREAPDVIMVGELREPETIRLTLNAAESGHLVIASLHAANSEDALYRICNSFPSEAQDIVRTQLSSVLSFLVVQKLEFNEKSGFYLPVLSILKGTRAVKSVIRENRFTQIEGMLQTSAKDGMFTQERYISDFLNKKTVFNSPGNIFKPSKESTKEKEYRSFVIDSNEGFESHGFKETLENKYPKIKFENSDKVHRPLKKARDEDLKTYHLQEDASFEDIIASFKSEDEK
ncbi:MAG: PilT/PilU family type 4a pilus ATPase [Desulforegulaceae bacterium]|nr:PilT/PilU family type 4a pilus ATPase [Desulforegulaceae bacterium]